LIGADGALVKILIRFGVLIVVLVAIWLAFNLFVHRPTVDKIDEARGKTIFTQGIGRGLDLMLKFQNRWPDILAAQRRDIEFIRTVLPEAPFNEKVYLSVLLDVFSKSGVDSKGVSIRPVRSSAKKVNFFSFFTADLGVLAASLTKFEEAFKYLNGSENIMGAEHKRFESLLIPQGASPEELELALWYSYQFNLRMAVDIPKDVAILPALEIHRFDTTIAGSYENVKHFIWMVQNMRPHTVIANWHLVPGQGTGESREYTATMTLVTFVDTNIPPVYEVDNPNMPDIKPLLKAFGI